MSCAILITDLKTILWDHIKNMNAGDWVIIFMDNSVNRSHVILIIDLKTMGLHQEHECQAIGLASSWTTVNMSHAILITNLKTSPLDYIKNINVR